MNTTTARRSERAKRNRWKPSLFLTIVLAAGVVCLLIVLILNDTAIGGVQRAYAVTTSGILRILGHRTAVLGNTVQSGEFGIAVVTACTGLFATSLFLVAVLVFPTSWRAKALGVAIGIGGIAVLNVIRLVSLYYVGLHWPSILNAMHQLVWQSLLIVAAVSLWLLWAGWIAGLRRMER